MLNALYMVLGGMAVVFAVLGILMLVMILLGRFFRPGKEGKEA
ncbi:MAG: OadG family protein [Chloroflexota bacterium]